MTWWKFVYLRSLPQVHNSAESWPMHQTNSIILQTNRQEVTESIKVLKINVWEMVTIQRRQGNTRTDGTALFWIASQNRWKTTDKSYGTLGAKEMMVLQVKALVPQAWGHEFKPPQEKASLYRPVTPVLYVVESGLLDSAGLQPSSRFWERPCIREKGGEWTQLRATTASLWRKLTSGLHFWPVACTYPRSSTLSPRHQ